MLILAILFILNHEKINSAIFWSEVFSFFVSLLFSIISLANITYKKVLNLGPKSIAITKRRYFCCKETKVYNFGELKRAEIISESYDSNGDNITNTKMYLILKSEKKEPSFILSDSSISDIGSFKDFIDLINQHIDKNMS